ncbi:MAG: glycosyltransferase [Methanomicrobiales archaeon]|jgi:glycosyltransferase involved in cell wall biosynthesis|nr:glycosyltransferase [Methanomicrobiales archaeon]
MTSEEKKPNVSLVIPVYNDHEALLKALPISLNALAAICDKYEIIIAEDASTDGSQEYAARLANENPCIRHLHRDERGGRGSALAIAAEWALYDIYVYFDVDLATDISHLKTLISAIENGYDMATGSRLLPASIITRSGEREMKSRGYNYLVRTLLRSKLYDHQCGFKAFNRQKLCDILLKVQDTHWFWDTEVLVLGQQAGYNVCEIPVRWNEGKGTTVKQSDVFAMGGSILKLWWRMHGL